MMEEFLFIVTIILLLGAAGVVGYLVRAATEFRKKFEVLNAQANDKIENLTLCESSLTELISKVERLQADVAGIKMGQGGRY